jgi:hypothetical protein
VKEIEGTGHQNLFEFTSAYRGGGQQDRQAETLFNDS